MEPPLFPDSCLRSSEIKAKTATATTATVTHDANRYLDADGLDGKEVVIDHFEQSHARGQVPGNTVHGDRRHILHTGQNAPQTIYVLGYESSTASAGKCRAGNVKVAFVLFLFFQPAG